MGWHRGHLAYCSNVHPGETLDAIDGNLEQWFSRVRDARKLRQMHAGLWLSREASLALVSSEEQLQRFAEQLRAHGLLLSTLNGFPFGGFHAQRVKETVYEPNWARRERLDYTLDLATVLSRCLPDDCREGTISTVPLGFAPGWTGEQHQQALHNLCELAGGLVSLKERTGRHIRVCLEMEPGCVLESTDEAVAFFRDDLRGFAADRQIDDEALRQHLGICYDVCHQAVMYETPAQSLEKLTAAGIVVGKIQLSCALDVLDPTDSTTQKSLAEFAEPRYLHQVRAVDSHGDLLSCMDLEEAFASAPMKTADAWRIHFHVPIQADSLAHGNLGTTQGELLKVLDYLANNPALRPHLEVETYTWQVLPPRLRPTDDRQLIDGLANELAWLDKALEERGLLTDD